MNWKDKIPMPTDEEYAVFMNNINKDSSKLISRKPKIRKKLKK